MTHELKIDLCFVAVKRFNIKDAISWKLGKIYHKKKILM